jgi:oxygen-independent coproporphyrinogen-3 oxidase
VVGDGNSVIIITMAAPGHACHLPLHRACYTAPAYRFRTTMPPIPPPLSLYVHLPWCVRKCPYCDFNSHPARAPLPEAAYVDALLRDLEAEMPRVWGRTIRTVFLGGGTPSLFAAAEIERLLSGLRARVTLAHDAEITLEANPGTVELEKFRGFRAAGVNRLSIGIQSFDDGKLKSLGRIHGRDEALRAAAAARAAGFENFNLDLMFGLPQQTPEQALADLDTALAHDSRDGGGTTAGMREVGHRQERMPRATSGTAAEAPTHLSLYQLTLEPNTLFHAQPPLLPDDETIFAMQQALQARLAHAGFQQYEVSAYAQPGQECRHNRNYWEFGDYLGLGAGAHGKLTTADGIVRYWKVKQPADYLAHAGTTAATGGARHILASELPGEFMLNALRLKQGFAKTLYAECTGLSLEALRPTLDAATQRGLLVETDTQLAPSELGYRFLNDLIGLFL